LKGTNVAHRIIITESSTPADPGLIAGDVHEPEFKVRVEYRPADSLTPAQIGNEMARVQRRVNQIIDGTPD
jgi:hypothetical protein